MYLQRKRGTLTTFIKNQEPFGHLNMMSLRAVLKSILGQWRELNLLADSPMFVGDERDALALLHEAARSGLLTVDNGSLHLTEKGKAIALAKAGRRLPKKDGLKILQTVVTAAYEFNKDRKSPIEINRIWLFGSMLDSRVKDVGDVDLVIEISFRSWATADNFSIFNYIHEIYPGLVTTAPWESYMIETHFINRKLFGRRRHPRVSLTDVDELIKLHCPCALAFEKGKMIDGLGEILPHHPRSTGRHLTIDVPISMVTLEAIEKLEPTSADILDATVRTHVSSEIIIATDRSVIDALDYPLIKLCSDFDARYNFGMLFGTPKYGDYGRETRRPFMMVVSRQITETAAELVLSVTIKIMIHPGIPNIRVDQDSLMLAGHFLELLIGADLIRMRFRADSLGLTFKLELIEESPVACRNDLSPWLEMVRTRAGGPVKLRSQWEAEQRRNRNDGQGLVPYNHPWTDFKTSYRQEP
jgi:predicted nucleotidyltransferase